MKAGYTIIELLFGLLLSSIIAMTLYNSFYTTSRTATQAAVLVGYDKQIAVLHNQLKRDIAGIFVPATGKREEAPAAQPTEKPITKITLQHLANSFYSVNKDEQFSGLTFITSNPPRVYEFAHNVQITPRMVRVTYRLVPDPQQPELFVLYRQEFDDLDFQRFAQSQTPGYAIARNIKSMKISYMAPEASQQKDQKGTTFTTRADWTEEQKQPLPQFVSITLVFVEPLHGQRKETTFEFEIPAYAWSVQPPKVKPTPPPAKKPVRDKKAPKDPNAPEEPKVETTVKVGEKTFSVKLPEWAMNMMQKGAA